MCQSSPIRQTPGSFSVGLSTIAEKHSTHEKDEALFESSVISLIKQLKDISKDHSRQCSAAQGNGGVDTHIFHTHP